MTLISINSSIRSTYLLIWFFFLFTALSTLFFSYSYFSIIFIVFLFGHFFLLRWSFLKENMNIRGGIDFIYFIEYAAHICHRKKTLSLLKASENLQAISKFSSNYKHNITLYIFEFIHFMHEKYIFFSSNIGEKTFVKRKWK